MGWIERMNGMVAYIESHLNDDIDGRELERITAIPLSLLHRMMPVIAGTTLTEYIRRRRLTQAAMELRLSDVKVIDLAIKYGYDSPTAFATAFKRQHGVTPAAARSGSVRVRHYSRLVFTIKVRGEEDMETRIVERDAFVAVGKAIKVNQETKDQIHKFWDACYSDGSDRLMLSTGKPPFLGVCYAMDEKGGFSYMIGLESTTDDIPTDLVTVNIPKSTWAVFDCVGPMPGAMHKTWDRIFTEYMPSEIYEHAGTPDLEVYYEGDVSAEDYHSEVWIPIVKKG